MKTTIATISELEKKLNFSKAFSKALHNFLKAHRMARDQSQQLDMILKIHQVTITVVLYITILGLGLSESLLFIN